MGRDQHLYSRDLPYKRYAWFERWQEVKPDWLGQCAGEFFGVFCYCYAGVGAQAASLLLAGVANRSATDSLFTIGAAYAAGIAFAITTGGMSSGAHFNPAFTVAMALWRDFPWRRVPRYIISQILGAFIAGLVVYCQYRPYLKLIEAGMIEAGHEAAVISSGGPAGVFGFYPNPGIPLRWAFANEFFTDFFLALVFWGAIDLSNVFTTPATVPLIIGLAFGVSVWSFAPAAAAMNPARDIGCRFVATAIWGHKAWGGRYAAITALTPFLSSISATTLYQIFLADHTRVIAAAAREWEVNKYARKAFIPEFRRKRVTSSFTGSAVSQVV